MKRKQPARIRSNFYLDSGRITVLKHIANREETSVSNLIRESIDRLVAERLRGTPSDREKLRADFDEFVKRWSGTGPGRTLAEIEDLVDEVDLDWRKRRRRS